MVALAVVAWSSAAAATPRPPNVVLIVADDMGWADIGVHGATDIPTPNIDAIAANGIRFTNGYVSGPYCSPARAGLLTGRYQQRFGHEFNLPDHDPNGLPLGETTLADRMRAAGYATGLVGKWHLGMAEPFHPIRRGFGDFFGFLGGAHPYFGADEGNPILRGTTVVEEKQYLTDAFGREAVAFIEAHKAKPFFLYLAFNAPHLPLQADDARLKKFASIADPARRTYAAMTFAMDEAIGKVVAKLRSESLLADTLLIFLNDNGGPTMQGTTINAAVNTPLRGSKRTTLEGGIRVAFMLQWPAKLRKGAVMDDPVIQLDLAPTLLAAAGVAPKPEWKLDGVDLLPYLTGTQKTPPHDALFWRLGKQMAVRRGDWKLVRYDRTVEHGSGVSDPKLYDLAHDVGESHDLAAEHPEKIQELQQLWERWNGSNVAPLWQGATRGRPD